jgi:hypothetical protein
MRSNLAGIVPLECGTWNGAVRRASALATELGVSMVVISPNMSSDLPFTVARYADVWDLSATMARVARVVDPS